MTFEHRNLDLTDLYERHLADEVGSVDALVLATGAFTTSRNAQRAFVMVVPHSEDPMLVGAVVWTGGGDRPYIRVKELGPVTVMLRRRLPVDLQQQLDLDRASDASFATTAGGDYVSSLWFEGLGGEAVALLRSVTPDNDDPVRLSVVAQWMEDKAFVSEVVATATVAELRELVEREFDTVMAI